MDAGLAAAVARADDHVIAFGERAEQGLDVGRVVLAVGVHEHQDVAAGGTGAALDRRAVAHRVRAGQDLGAVAAADLGGGVGGAVVDHDQFGVRIELAQCRQGTEQAFCFVLGGQDDADTFHVVSPVSPRQC
ncbi:hypothetical protein D3C71_1579980 [compost metagenome]